MAGTRTILIADDEAHIRQVVRFALEKAGLRCLEAEDGPAALDAWERHRPDLVILDIVMPGMDGMEVAGALRARSRVPIVFLTSRDDEIDRILGLELGGDDYVTKPFSPRELVARVRAILRRSTPPVGAAPSEKLAAGLLRLDPERFQAFWGDREVVLTVTEFSLLRALLAAPGRVLTRQLLMDAAYEPGIVVSDRTIDSHIRRVRRKFESAGGYPIETVHGLGYKLGDCR